MCAFRVSQEQIEKIDSHLTNEQKTTLIRRLEETIKKGETRIDSLKRHFSQIETGHSDAADSADEMTERESTLQELEREKRQIQTASNTINYIINNNEYGYCAECGVEIPFQRLNAFPSSTLCIDCKSKQEMLEKHIAK